MKDYYKVMYMSRQSFSIEKLENKYKVFRRMLEQNYEMYKDKSEYLEKLAELEKEFNEAYSVLSDDEKRKQYDDMLDEEYKKGNDENHKKEQEKNRREDEKQEKYSCFKMYDSSLIKSVKYTRNNKREIFFSPYTFEEGKSARKVSCKLLGFISYNMDYKEEQYKLARYEVKSISTQNPETTKYVVITPVIDYYEVCKNEEYKKAICEKLFSEKNLERSKHENYEYLGKIIKNKDGYDIDYDQEEFCASVRFGNKLKRRVDNPKKAKEGIIGKFKNKRNRTKMIFKEDDFER